MNASSAIFKRSTLLGALLEADKLNETLRITAIHSGRWFVHEAGFKPKVYLQIPLYDKQEVQ